MSAIVIISLLLAITVMSLLVVNFVNRRETRRRLVTQRVAAIRRRIAELEEMSASVEPLLESTQIPRAINDEIVYQIETIVKLEPDNAYMEPTLKAAKGLSEDLALEKRSCQHNRTASSDSQVARCKYQLNEAAKLIRKNQLAARIDALEADTFIKELSWASMMIDVITFVNQGHISMKQGDVLKGYSYYKHAQQALIASPHPDERRHRFIREVSDMLVNRRIALSEDLMPETQNNPTGSVQRPPGEQPSAPHEQAPPAEGGAARGAQVSSSSPNSN